MSLRIKKSLSDRHVDFIENRTRKKVFIICEGTRTEIKYFEGLKNNSKSLGVNQLIDILPLNKTGNSKGISNPYGMVELVDKFIEENKEGDSVFIDFDKDKFLLVFDRDKGDFIDYIDFINEYKSRFIFGITNPCFEIWLLLHKENSVNELIMPNYDEILENKKISCTHTKASKLVSDTFNINPKSRLPFSLFKDLVPYAISQEKELEQNIIKLENKIGSNIGKVIKELLY